MAKRRVPPLFLSGDSPFYKNDTPINASNASFIDIPKAGDIERVRKMLGIHKVGDIGCFVRPARDGRENEYLEGVLVKRDVRWCGKLCVMYKCFEAGFMLEDSERDAMLFQDNPEKMPFTDTDSGWRVGTLRACNIHRKPLVASRASAKTENKFHRCSSGICDVGIWLGAKGSESLPGTEGVRNIRKQAYEVVHSDTVLSKEFKTSLCKRVYTAAGIGYDGIGRLNDQECSRILHGIGEGKLELERRRLEQQQREQQAAAEREQRSLENGIVSLRAEINRFSGQCTEQELQLLSVGELIVSAGLMRTRSDLRQVGAAFASIRASFADIRNARNREQVISRLQLSKVDQRVIETKPREIFLD